MIKQMIYNLRQNFFWRLILLNVLGIAFVVVLSSLAIYHTACYLVDGMAGFDSERQQLFNTTLFHYLLLFAVSGIVVGSFIHIYMTRKIIAPVRQIIRSMKTYGTGMFPKKITTKAEGELGLLIEQYNQMIDQLEEHDHQRKKLVTDLSHEIRTPLANLQGYLHGLHTGILQGDEELFKSLYDETKRLTNLLEQLDQLKQIDYKSGRTALHRESLDISVEINQSLSMFAWTLKEKNINIKQDIEPAQLLANQADLQRVLANLLDNAIRYYHGDGPIGIKGSYEKHVYKICVSGPGEKIPEEAVPQLFDRFFLVDPSRNRSSGGTGLGLAIVKEIIVQHGGNIGFQRRDLVNEFWFTLPIDEA